MAVKKTKYDMLVELLTDWENDGRLDLILDAILLDTGTDGVVVNSRTAAFDKLVGVAQIAVEPLDLDSTAVGSYHTLIATDQDIIIESLIFHSTRALSGDAGFTGISVETDDTTPQVFISEAEGVKANLTAESQLAWTGAVLLREGQYIDFSIYGGAVANAESLCQIVVGYRAVVSGGYLV